MDMTKQSKGFEASMERLEEIVRALESGDMGLEESLALYEEGIATVRACSEMLEKAEQSVKVLRLQNDGSVTLAEFNAGGVDA